jgi:amino acid adenylation domain-containing protein
VTTLPERFHAVADRAPEAIAIVDGERSMTYAELARAARAVTARLAAADVRPGTLVGLRLPRSADVATAILGILGHGCGYVPIDPAYPAPRQQLITEEARLDFAVQLEGADLVPVRLRPPGGPVWDVPSDIAYVIFTSGSTGRPKGVMVGHRHVLALLDACYQCYDVGPDDVWTLFHSYSFDFSVWELWGALLSGGQAVVVPSAIAADPRQFAALLAAEEVTVLNQVPTAFSHLVAELADSPRPLPALRSVIFGGEAIGLSSLRRWRDLGCAPRARLVNMYGITETTVHVTYCPLTDAHLDGDWPGTPIGRPLPHLRIQLTDQAGRRVPAGAEGQIAVLGDAVSYGYLGRPDLTAERFVFRQGRGGPAYLSGDWARPVGDGLYYLGRRDRQVKLRGYRIELGEIEAALSTHPAVAHCAVTTEPTARGEPVLAAYYTCWSAGTVEAPALRAYLADRLPAHMVPARLRARAGLPVTPHGKVDLAALDRSSSSSTLGSGTGGCPGNPTPVPRHGASERVVPVQEHGARWLGRG